VLLQPRLRGILAQEFGECPLVLCGVALKDRWRNPWFENEPSTCIDTPDLFVAIVEWRGALQVLSLRRLAS
jgi:hypothetical protein